MKNLLLASLAGLILVLYIGSLLNQNHTGGTNQPAPTPGPEKPSCDAKMARELVDGMINETHILRSIRTEPSIPKITVDHAWFTLDFETKKIFDNAVLCYLANGYTSRVPLVSYLDPMTGKKIASSGPSGFSME